MSASFLLILAAAACFIFEGLGISLGVFSPKWWAIGVAFYLLAQVIH